MSRGEGVKHPKHLLTPLTAYIVYTVESNRVLRAAQVDRRHGVYVNSVFTRVFTFTIFNDIYNM